MRKKEPLDGSQIDGFPSSPFSVNCFPCRHLERDKYFADTFCTFPTCTAFPEGIPLEIWEGEIDHKKTYPGDNGIVFEPLQSNNVNNYDDRPVSKWKKLGVLRDKGAEHKYGKIWNDT